MFSGAQGRGPNPFGEDLPAGRLLGEVKLLGSYSNHTDFLHGALSETEAIIRKSGKEPYFRFDDARLSFTPFLLGYKISVLWSLPLRKGGVVSQETDIMSLTAAEWAGDGTPAWIGRYEVDFCGHTIHVAGTWIPGSYGLETTYFAAGDSAAVVNSFLWHLAGLKVKKLREISKVFVFTGSQVGEERTAARLEDLVLAPGLKDKLRANIEGFFGGMETYKKAGLSYKRGLLLVGPPGNGKTSAVRAIISEFNTYPCFLYGFSSEDNHDLDNLRYVLARAEDLAPAMVILEDIDRLASGPDSESMRSLLNMLDGIGSKQGVLIIATSNNPEKLDPALVDRPSRFDVLLRFDSPSADMRQEYIRKKIIKEFPQFEDQIGSLIGDTATFSMAMMQEFRTQLLLLSLRAKRDLGLTDLRECLSALRMSKDLAAHITGQKVSSVGFSI